MEVNKQSFRRFVKAPRREFGNGVPFTYKTRILDKGVELTLQSGSWAGKHTIKENIVGELHYFQMLLHLGYNDNISLDIEMENGIIGVGIRYKGLHPVLDTPLKEPVFYLGCLCVPLRYEEYLYKFLADLSAVVVEYGAIKALVQKVSFALPSVKVMQVGGTVNITLLTPSPNGKENVIREITLVRHNVIGLLEMLKAVSVNLCPKVTVSSESCRNTLTINDGATGYLYDSIHHRGGKTYHTSFYIAYYMIEMLIDALEGLFREDPCGAKWLSVIEGYEDTTFSDGVYTHKLSEVREGKLEPGTPGKSKTKEPSSPKTETAVKTETVKTETAVKTEKQDPLESDVRAILVDTINNCIGGPGVFPAYIRLALVLKFPVKVPQAYGSNFIDDNSLRGFLMRLLQFPCLQRMNIVSDFLAEQRKDEEAK